ncbi:hypothetical protein B7Z28_00305 [Candidatus Saccharibacteria bacterium 32-45-3]|nr:MAG: hypothetical protein B7Z28_00305 [Candidatus Saccharibacteria bacterium 32-45-3]
MEGVIIMNNMNVTIARHGETEENVNKIVQGHWPGTLTALGKEQSRALAEKLKNEHFDIIYSSDLRRCVDTVNYISALHADIPVHQLRGLREIYFGDWEGLREADVNWEKPVDDFWSYSRGGGETNEDFYHRVVSCFNSIYKQHPNDDVLIVTHGWSMKVLQAAITGEELEALYPVWLDNAATVHYAVTGPLEVSPRVRHDVLSAAHL